MKFKSFASAVALLVLGSGFASAQTWAPLAHQPGAPVGAMVQLRDGRVLVHEEQGGNSANWHILTPDSTGSYANGTWSSGGTLPTGYKPWFFSSQVFLDGKHVLVEGGEYNNGSGVWTTLGAMYDVTTNTWTSNGPPSGWTHIGDAQSIILADGRYMQADCCSTKSAFFNGPNAWVANGNIVGPDNDEGGYTMLPNDKVIMVDAWNAPGCGTNMSSELFDPSSNSWSCGPHTPTQMWDNSGHELGPAILMYTGKMFQVGAVPSTAVYDPAANTWAAGPTPSGGLDGADAPAALEPNGKVLVMLSPGEFQGGCQMVEYNPALNTLANTANPQNCPADSSFVGHLMILPTGEIMFTDFSGRVELYTPAPSPTVNVKRPQIISHGVQGTFQQTNNVLQGFNLNGFTQNNGYGDDYQGDTNYPLVRITNIATGQVYYGITHDESTHSINPAAGLMTTMFDLPANFPLGPSYRVQVVASGVASQYLIYH